MKEAHIKVLWVTKFTWSAIEVVQGMFDFKWLDEIDLLMYSVIDKPCIHRYSLD